MELTTTVEQGTVVEGLMDGLQRLKENGAKPPYYVLLGGPLLEEFKGEAGRVCVGPAPPLKRLPAVPEGFRLLGVLAGELYVYEVRRSEGCSCGGVS